MREFEGTVVLSNCTARLGQLPCSFILLLTKASYPSSSSSSAIPWLGRPLHGRTSSCVAGFDTQSSLVHTAASQEFDHDLM